MKPIPLNCPLEQVSFCVVDIETTGFQPTSDRVVEIAGVYFSLEAGVTHREGYLVNPGRPIPKEATAIHGLIDSDVANADTLEFAIERLINKHFDVWVAHNAGFDFGFIPAGGIPVACTLVLARRLWPDLPNHKNQTLRLHWNLEIPEIEGLSPHRADPDAMVTASLLRLQLQVLQERYPEIKSLGDFLEWMNTPYLLPVCVVGKRYRGLPWVDVPTNYLGWVLETYDNLDLDLRATLQHHLEQRNRPSVHLEGVRRVS